MVEVRVKLWTFNMCDIMWPAVGKFCIDTATQHWTLTNEQKVNTDYINYNGRALFNELHALQRSFRSDSIYYTICCTIDVALGGKHYITLILTLYQHYNAWYYTMWQ